MLPLVLGGIALAAVGYGMKEYCESEGCPWDEEPERTYTAPVNLFESLHQKKLELYEHKLRKLRELVLQFEGVDKKLQLKDTANIYEETLLQSELEDDVKLYANMYMQTVHTSTSLVDTYIYTLEVLLTKEKHYHRLDTLEKKLIKRVYRVVNNVQKLLALRLLDGKTLNVATITTLKKLQEKLDVLATHKNI
jgi:uncharacterized protein YicC (UPF0701 family)